MQASIQYSKPYWIISFITMRYASVSTDHVYGGRGVIVFRNIRKFKTICSDIFMKPKSILKKSEHQMLGNIYVLYVWFLFKMSVL